MKRFRMIDFLFFIVISGFVAISFQNCGGRYNTQISSEKPSLQLEVDDFFGYSFAPGSKFYMTQQLFKPESSFENLTEFKYSGAISYFAERYGPINYMVNIETESGVPLCPQREGSLQPGKSAIEFDCVTAVRADKAIVVLKASFDDSIGGQRSETLRNIFK